MSILYFPLAIAAGVCLHAVFYYGLERILRVAWYVIQSIAIVGLTLAVTLTLATILSKYPTVIYLAQKFFENYLRQF